MHMLSRLLRSRVSMLGVWLAGLATPALMLLAIAYVHHIPAVPGVLRLTGDWRIAEGDSPGGSEPSLDDTAWRALRLPGFYTKNGFTNQDAWLRKEFQLSEAPRDPLFLVIGDSRTSQMRVFLNGHFVGDKGGYGQTRLGDINSAEGWALSPEFLRPGRNVLALQVHWLSLNRDWVADGFLDQRLYLGPLELLRPAFLRSQQVDALLRTGPVLVYMFVVWIMLSLAWFAESANDRRRYLSVVALVATAGAYVSLYSGLFTSWLPVTLRVDLLYFVIASLGLVFNEFFERQSLGRTTRWAKVFRGIFVALSVGGLVTLFIGGSALAYGLVAGWIFVGIGYWNFLVFRDAAARRGTVDDPNRLSFVLALVLAMGTLVLSLAGIVDLATDLGVVTLPRVFPPALMALPIVVSIVVIGDFLRITQRNVALASSLARSHAELTTLNVQLETNNSLLTDALAGANEATRVKSQFLTTVSHELRTPLNAIINIPLGLLEDFESVVVVTCGACSAQTSLNTGQTFDSTTQCSSCLAMGTLTSQTKRTYRGDPELTAKHLRNIERSGTQLLGLVDQVLDLSKLEGGKMTLHLEQVDACEVLARVVTTLEPLAQPRGVALAVTGASKACQLRADPVMLARIFTSLIDNAVKFSSDGGTVAIAVRDDGPSLLFQVRDQGIGIAREDQALIFESFRQVEGGSTRRYGGAGLGLSLTREMVKLHAGEIRVDSEPGQGCIFEVRLPRAGPSMPASSSARLG